VIAEIERDVVTGRAGADHDHPARGADELRRRQRRLTRMLEDDLRAHAIAERVPDGLAEAARSLGPLAVGLGVTGVRHLAPVGELRAIDHAGGAVIHAELALVVVRYHGDRAPADRARDLERHAAETAGGAQDRKSTRLNSSHVAISYAVFCLKKKRETEYT